jgi:hypothetical protein
MNTVTRLERFTMVAVGLVAHRLLQLVPIHQSAAMTQSTSLHAISRGDMKVLGFFEPLFMLLFLMLWNRTRIQASSR